MTSQPPPDPSGHDRDHLGPDGSEPLDPDQEAVRGLLAEAGGRPEALPTDVATRLDDVLAGLVAERGSGVADSPAAAALGAAGPAGTDEAVVAGSRPRGGGDDVVGADELGARRRRRWPQLLVAAAAVSVIGLGVGNLDDLTGGDSEEAMSSDAPTSGQAADSRDMEAAPEKTAEDSAGVTSSNDADRGAAPQQLRANGHTAGVNPPRLRSASLAADVQSVGDSTLLADSEAAEAWSDACVQPAASPDDEWLAVRLDGEPAVLVLRAPEGGRRTADVFTCDDADTPAASTTIDAR